MHILALRLPVLLPHTHVCPRPALTCICTLADPAPLSVSSHFKLHFMSCRRTHPSHICWVAASFTPPSPSPIATVEAATESTSMPAASSSAPAASTASTSPLSPSTAVLPYAAVAGEASAVGIAG